MRFANEQFLHLLWLLPVLFAIEFYAAARRRQSLSRLGDAALIGRLTESLNRRRRRLKFFFLAGAVVLLALAAARPQYGTRLRMVERKGIDLVIALDVSKSMLAEDVKPSRLVRARNEIASLIDRLKGDRIGLVAFAGDAFVQCPLTLDYSAVKMLLDAVDVYSVPEPGTNLAKAINVSVSTFPKGGGRERALLLLTDGEGHMGGEIEAARGAREEGVRIFCIGVGSKGGSPIPLRGPGGDLVEYKKDKEGGSVITRLNEPILQSIATVTEGAYHASTPGQVELGVVLDSIDKMEKTEFGAREWSEAEEKYQYFLLPGLLLLAAFASLGERKREK
jgi:Ca-activated chloride channel family protein